MLYISIGMNLPEALKRESQLMGSNEVIPVMRKSSFKNQTTSQGRVATWLLDTSGFEQCSKGMSTMWDTITDDVMCMYVCIIVKFNAG